MIEEPDIADEKIISVLVERFSVSARGVEFMPLGWDNDSWSYRVNAAEGIYFLKLRKGFPNPAGVFLPRFLKEQGIEQVMACILSANGEAWEKVDDFCFILYPFIVGEQVLDVGMSDAHWVEFGSVLNRLHTTKLPPEILSQMKREVFVPPRLEWIKRLHNQVKTYKLDDPFQKELAEFWLENYSTISTILERTDTLIKQMEGANIEFVPCHGDVHTGNLLITEDNKIFIVDWEDTRLAPKERDLIFLPGDLGTKQEELFFQGYGEPQINSLAAAYYRHHWCVEDMGFSEHIFTEANVGEKTKKDAMFWFKSLFAPKNSIETALNTEVEIRE